MQNYDLLHALGRSGKPVLLKRGAGATLQELLLSAEHILSAGNPNVILCERGIRTFENTHTRFTLDLSAVPVLKSLLIFPFSLIPATRQAMRALWRRLRWLPSPQARMAFWLKSIPTRPMR